MLPYFNGFSKKLRIEIKIKQKYYFSDALTLSLYYMHYKNNTRC